MMNPILKQNLNEQRTKQLEKEIQEKNLTTYESKSSYKSLLKTRFERKKSYEIQYIEPKRVSRERQSKEPYLNRAHNVNFEDLNFKIENTDPNNMSTIELKQSLNFLKNKYNCRTKELNDMRQKEQFVMQTARTVLNKAPQNIGNEGENDEKQRIRKEMDVINEQLKKQSSLYQSLMLSDTNSYSQEPPNHTFRDECLPNGKIASIQDQFDRQKHNDVQIRYLKQSMEKENKQRVSMKSIPSSNFATNSSKDLNLIQTQMRQIMQELTAQQIAQKEDKKRLEQIQQMLSPMSRADRSFSPSNREVEQTSTVRSPDSNQVKIQSIRNIQTAYHKKIKQLQSTRNSTSGTSVPASKVNSQTQINEIKPMDTQVIQLCEISPENDRDEQQPEALKEFDKLDLDKLHQQIDRSLNSKQEQLKKLQQHYSVQESMIENKIKDLENRLSYQEDTNEDELLNTISPDKQPPVKENTYLGIKTFLNTHGLSSPTYSYSKPNSVQRRLKDQENQLQINNDIQDVIGQEKPNSQVAQQPLDVWSVVSSTQADGMNSLSGLASYSKSQRTIDGNTHKKDRSSIQIENQDQNFQQNHDVQDLYQPDHVSQQMSQFNVFQSHHPPQLDQIHKQEQEVHENNRDTRHPSQKITIGSGQNWLTSTHNSINQLQEPQIQQQDEQYLNSIHAQEEVLSGDILSSNQDNALEVNTHSQQWQYQGVPQQFPEYFNNPLVVNTTDTCNRSAPISNSQRSMSHFMNQYNQNHVDDQQQNQNFNGNMTQYSHVNGNCYQNGYQNNSENNDSNPNCNEQVIDRNRTKTQSFDILQMGKANSSLRSTTNQNHFRDQQLNIQENQDHGLENSQKQDHRGMQYQESHHYRGMIQDGYDNLGPQNSGNYSQRGMTLAQDHDFRGAQHQANQGHQYEQYEESHAYGGTQHQENNNLLGIQHPVNHDLRVLHQGSGPLNQDLNSIASCDNVLVRDPSQKDTQASPYGDQYNQMNCINVYRNENQQDQVAPDYSNRIESAPTTQHTDQALVQKYQYKIDTKNLKSEPIVNNRQCAYCCHCSCQQSQRVQHQSYNQDIKDLMSRSIQTTQRQTTGSVVQSSRDIQSQAVELGSRALKNNNNMTQQAYSDYIQGQYKFEMGHQMQPQQQPNNIINSCIQLQPNTLITSATSSLAHIPQANHQSVQHQLSPNPQIEELQYRLSEPQLNYVDTPEDVLISQNRPQPMDYMSLVSNRDDRSFKLPDFSVMHQQSAVQPLENTSPTPLLSALTSPGRGNELDLQINRSAGRRFDRAGEIEVYHKSRRGSNEVSQEIQDRSAVDTVRRLSDAISRQHEITLRLKMSRIEKEEALEKYQDDLYELKSARYHNRSKEKKSRRYQERSKERKSSRRKHYSKDGRDHNIRKKRTSQKKSSRSRSKTRSEKSKERSCTSIRSIILQNSANLYGRKQSNPSDISQKQKVLSKTRVISRERPQNLSSSSILLPKNVTQKAVIRRLPSKQESRSRQVTFESKENLNLKTDSSIVPTSFSDQKSAPANINLKFNNQSQRNKNMLIESNLSSQPRIVEAKLKSAIPRPSSKNSFQKQAAQTTGALTLTSIQLKQLEKSVLDKLNSSGLVKSEKEQGTRAKRTTKEKGTRSKSKRKDPEHKAKTAQYLRDKERIVAKQIQIIQQEVERRKKSEERRKRSLDRKHNQYQPIRSKSRDKDVASVPYGSKEEFKLNLMRKMNGLIDTIAQL